MHSTTISVADLKNIGLNNLSSASYLLAVFSTAYIINKMAHFIFNPALESRMKKAIQWSALAIGLGVSVYVAPKVTLVAFTAQKVLNLFALSFIATSTVYAMLGKSPIVVLPLTLFTGAFFGIGGTHLLASLGTLSAGIGAVWQA